jgi:enoyl-CoA hydratase/carnithine racemase
VTDQNRQHAHPFIDVLVAEGVATLAITRPQAGNALNWAVLEQLRGAMSRATADPAVEAIVITGSGNSFVSGADLGFFVRCLQSADMGRIVECIRASQEVFEQIATSPKPVVAAVQGAAVGGGVELALACRHILASPRASFSFPETSLGIVPFSGGTYRTPRRIGAELTRWLVYTGQVVPPPMALKLGLIDELVMPDQLPAAAQEAARRLSGTVTPMSLRRTGPDEQFGPLREMIARQTVESLRTAEPPADRQLAAAIKAIAARPALALAWAERLIATALDTSTSDAAAQALAAVPVLFADAEVRTRMESAAQTQQRKS